jgi:hypothetical protein
MPSSIGRRSALTGAAAMGLRFRCLRGRQRHLVRRICRGAPQPGEPLRPILFSVIAGAAHALATCKSRHAFWHVAQAFLSMPGVPAT